jgi:hypothetical protein
MKVSNNSRISKFSTTTRSSVSRSPPKKRKVAPEVDLFLDVNMRNSKFRIHCLGKNTFKWLQNVAIHYYDEHYGLHSGSPFIIMTKDDVMCSPGDIIQKVFKTNGEVNIMFLGNIELI